jgi:hypothetical protein
MVKRYNEIGQKHLTPRSRSYSPRTAAPLARAAAAHDPRVSASTPLPAKTERPRHRPNPHRRHARRFSSMGISAAATTRAAVGLPLWHPAPATVGYGKASSWMRSSDDASIDLFFNISPK